MKKCYVIKFYFWLILFLLSGCTEKAVTAPLEMAFILKGEFTMGSNKVSKKDDNRNYFGKSPLYLSEHPERKVYLPGYFIDIYEVTNERYKVFDSQLNIPENQNNYPITEVSWIEADQFCRWENKTLPTEAQWEKAARGTDARQYPWGDIFDELKLNTGKYSLGTAPVGIYTQGVSPYGIYDMAGNVWEWTYDWYEAYPGSDYSSISFGKKFKVIRGGARVKGGHYALPVFYRSAHRLGVPPDSKAIDTGFRCVKVL